MYMAFILASLWCLIVGVKEQLRFFFTIFLFSCFTDEFQFFDFTMFCRQIFKVNLTPAVSLK